MPDLLGLFASLLSSNLWNNTQCIDQRGLIMLDRFFMASATGQVLSQIEHAQANQAAHKGTKQTAQLTLMQGDIEKLFMITEALWEILKYQHGYTDDQLVEMIHNIDLKDGKLDGKVARTPAPPCPSCSRPLPLRQATCLYCGAPNTHSPFKP